MFDGQVYHSRFQPLEWTVAAREQDACYAKLVCVKSLQVNTQHVKYICTLHFDVINAHAQLTL